MGKVKDVASTAVVMAAVLAVFALGVYVGRNSDSSKLARALEVIVSAQSQQIQAQTAAIRDLQSQLQSR